MAPQPLILIVDDNLDAREMYGMYLQHEGFRWAEAVNGHDALMQTKIEKPALILIDATMPRMDGWEAVRLLKEDESTKHIPLIMLTAHAFDEHRIPGRLARAVQLHAIGDHQRLGPCVAPPAREPDGDIFVPLLRPAKERCQQLATLRLDDG